MNVTNWGREERSAPDYDALEVGSFAEVDIRIRVKCGGRISQIYAIRQVLSKVLVAYEGQERT